MNTDGFARAQIRRSTKLEMKIAGYLVIRTHTEKWRLSKMGVFAFVGGIIIGTIFSATALYFTTMKDDEKEIEAARQEAATWESQARHWEAEAIRAKDNERIARKMQQYWRARCMNEHFGFNAACDGDGVRPVVVCRDENNDICDGLLLAAVKEENAV
jgi:hypothetical protein